MISGGAPVASLMISGGVSRPIGHRTNIVSVKKWGGPEPPKPPCSEAYGCDYYLGILLTMTKNRVDDSNTNN